MQRFGISGAHKSGKTTLAKAVADKWGLKYIDVNLSSVNRAFGASPNEIIPFARRLEIQRNMVSHCINLFSEAEENYISDRTFIDVAAYTLSYMPHVVSDIESETVKLIVDQCYRAQVAFFDKTIIIGNSFDIAPHPDNSGKGAFSWSWNFQLQTLMRGLVLNANMKCPVSFIPDSHNTVSQRMSKMEVLIGETQRESGISLH